MLRKISAGMNRFASRNGTTLSEMAISITLLACFTAILILAEPEETPFEISTKLETISVPSGIALGNGYITAARNAQDGATSAEDTAYFVSTGLSLPTDGNGMILVRKTDIVEGLADYGEGFDVRARKRLFIQALLPAAVAANHDIWNLRCDISGIRAAIEDGRKLPDEDEALLRITAATYGMKIRDGLAERTDMLDVSRALESRIDVVPPSLLIAMAAHDTNWGTKRSSIEQGALFRTSPVVLNGSAPHASIKDQLATQMTRFNHWAAFSALRKVRARNRENEIALASPDLADSLAQASPYTTIDAAFIKRTIEQNGLTALDDAHLTTENGALKPPSGAAPICSGSDSI